MNDRTDNEDFAFFCPECSSMKKMRKSNIGRIIECEECCEKVKVDYPKARPCPRCRKSIKLKAKVCKYCKQRVMPFVDPFDREPDYGVAVSLPAGRPKAGQHIKALAVALISLSGGFAAGLYGTRAIAKITRSTITGNADYIVAAILGIYLAIHFYRSRKDRS